MENLTQRLGKVIAGDEELTRESGLEEKEVGKPSMPSITWMSLQLEHARCAEIIAAANHLGLPILEQTAKVAIHAGLALAVKRNFAARCCLKLYSGNTNKSTKQFSKWRLKILF